MSKPPGLRNVKEHPNTVHVFDYLEGDNYVERFGLDSQPAPFKDIPHPAGRA
jgi:hypothetical protein